MRRVDLAAGDFAPGDPAQHVMGRGEEQPARRHGEPPRKPFSAQRILIEIRERMDELRPLVAEVDELERVLKAWPEPEPKPKRGRRRTS